MPVLVVVTDSGQVQVPFTEAEIDRRFGQQDLARVFINRTVFEQEVESLIESGSSECYIFESASDTDENLLFGGLAKEPRRSGSVTELIIETFERFARDAAPTAGDDVFQAATDDFIVTDAIDAIPELSAGTVAQEANALSLVFSHSSQARKIRKVAEVSGAEVRYNPDKSVDYLTRRGQDRSVTLSPANNNIGAEFSANKISGADDVTHLRLVGSGEGQSQQVVNLVPSADASRYTSVSEFRNVRTYTASHWSPGDRRQWKTDANKDLQSIDSLERAARTYIDDAQVQQIEITTTIPPGTDVNLGDEFTVTYESENISEISARVIENTERLTPRGIENQVTLNTRRQSVRQQASENRKDIDKYNYAFEGNNVQINTSGGRQPVDSNNDYLLRLYYPDEVEFEHRLNVRVVGLPYRAYSSGAATTSFTQDTTENSAQDITLSDSISQRADSTAASSSSSATSGAQAGGSSTAESIDDIGFSKTLPPGGSEFLSGGIPNRYDGNAQAFVSAKVSTTSDPGQSLAITVQNSSGGTLLSGDFGTGIGGDVEVRGPLFFVDGGDFLEMEIENTSFEDIQLGLGTRFNFFALNHEHTFDPSDHSHGITIPSHSHTFELPQHQHDVTFPAHEHDADPGIQENFASDSQSAAGGKIFPENCDVIVNGSALNQSFGDGTGEFAEKVDIRGELTPGQVNTIEISTEQLGHIQAFVEGDVYRQVNGQG